MKYSIQNLNVDKHLKLVPEDERKYEHEKTVYKPTEDNDKDTPGTKVGPGFCDRTLAKKSRKNTRKSAFVKKTFEFNFHFICYIPSSCVKI